MESVCFSSAEISRLGHEPHQTRLLLHAIVNSAECMKMWCSFLSLLVLVSVSYVWFVVRLQVEFPMCKASPVTEVSSNDDVCARCDLPTGKVISSSVCQR